MEIIGIAERPRFHRRELLLLFALTALGAVFRVIYQIDRPFLGDEIGTLIHIEKSYAYLLTHFETWLSMDYFLVLEKFLASSLGTSPAVLTAVPFLFGVGTIPLTALVGARSEPAFTTRPRRDSTTFPLRGRSTSRTICGVGPQLFCSYSESGAR